MPLGELLSKPLNPEDKQRQEVMQANKLRLAQGAPPIPVPEGGEKKKQPGFSAGLSAGLHSEFAETGYRVGQNIVKSLTQPMSPREEIPQEPKAPKQKRPSIIRRVAGAILDARKARRINNAQQSAQSPKSEPSVTVHPQEQLPGGSAIVIDSEFKE